jgi:DNA-binding transcriptional LysR family regulator
MDQLRSIRTFCKVCEVGGFAAAARALDLAPSAVTRLVIDLESRLGTRLLNRTTRKLSLTPAGESYLRQVTEALALLDLADTEAADQAAAPKGRVHLTAPLELVKHQIIKLLPEFRRRYPQIDLHLAAPRFVAQPDPAADVSLLLVRGTPLLGDFVARRLASPTELLCATPAYLEACGVPRHPRELVDHACLFPAHPDVPSEYRFSKLDSDDPPEIVSPRLNALTSTSQDALVSAALFGMGPVGMLSFSAQPYLQSGQLVRLLPEWNSGRWHLHAALHSTRHMPRRVRVLLDFLAAHWGDAAHDPWLA